MSKSELSSQSVPEHLNSSGCCIKYSEGKGRGVYASRAIPRETIIDISPVLLFSIDEYDRYGRFTVLEQYTFKWRDGRMALALGLGSLFNHSETPNVSYTIDPLTDSIRYTTVRQIECHEELCIFYGHNNLWFDPVGSRDLADSDMLKDNTDDGWGGLSMVEDEVRVLNASAELCLDGNPDEIIAEEDLPFTRYQPAAEEEKLDDIQTVTAWVVDIPESRQITTMLKWLKQSGLEASELGHLKRVRKMGETSTLLLSTSPSPPANLPLDLNLPDPYMLAVPVSPALTLTSLTLKSSLWPTVYAPRRKDQAEGWSRGKARWAWEAMKLAIEEAARARTDGELPIVTHVPASYETKSEAPIAFTARDTRISTAHPLRHAVINVIRRIADYRASSLPPEASTFELATSTSPSEGDVGGTRNGTNYLLTSLTLFTTHEPCIMCSMALLHSRVKEVIYLLPMDKTGGCGGLACLPTLEGVNHRFGICRWKEVTDNIDMLALDVTTDA